MTDAKFKGVGYTLKEVFECVECGKPVKCVKCVKSQGSTRKGTHWQCADGHVNKGRNHYIKRTEIPKQS